MSLHQSCAIVALATFAFIAKITSHPTQKFENTDGQFLPEELVLLGTVDNVSFFVEGTTFRYYHQSKAYCEEAGLRLASIKTKAQADVIFNGLAAKGLPAQWYATSLRESRDFSNYVWGDDNSTNADPSLFANGVYDGMDPEKVQIGGWVYVNVTDGTAGAQLSFISTADGRAKTLCQLS